MHDQCYIIFFLLVKFKLLMIFESIEMTRRTTWNRCIKMPDMPIVILDESLEAITSQ